MAGSIDLSTQGITSAFRVESQTPTPQTKPHPQENSGAADGEAPKSEFDKKALQGVADGLNAASQLVDRNLSFSVDEKSGRIVIKVTNSETGELIRVIPPEDISKSRDTAGSLVGLLYNAAR